MEAAAHRLCCDVCDESDDEHDDSHTQVESEMMKIMEIKVWYAPYRLYCVASDDVLGNFPSQDQYP